MNNLVLLQTVAGFILLLSIILFFYPQNMKCPQRKVEDRVRISEFGCRATIPSISEPFSVLTPSPIEQGMGISSGVKENLISSYYTEAYLTSK